MSLIDVLVTAGITLILLGLAFPALSDGVEAARKVKCKARLSDLGKALNAFHASNGAFPFWNRGAERDQSPFEAHLSPHASLLPFIEQQTTFDAINFKVPRVAFSRPALENETAARARIAAFVCPSESLPPPEQWGPVNFRCNSGTMVVSETGGRPFPSWRKGNGGFKFNAALRAKDFTDGLAQTAMLAEKSYGRPQLRTEPFDPKRSVWHSTVVFFDPKSLLAVCSADRPLGHLYDSAVGTSWMVPVVWQVGYTHDAPPNSTVPDCIGAFGKDFGSFGARSEHPGGVCALFSDGHVKFLANSTDTSIWRGIGTRAGNEAVSGRF